MRTENINVYTFDELSDEAKERAIEKFWDINVDYEWWESVYDDAEQVGLKILGFNIDRGSYVEAKFMASAEETAHKIEKSHGELTETYKTAEAYLAERDKTIEEAPKDENGDFENEHEIDNLLDELDSEFLKSICEDYRIMLQNEYEYLSSREAIIETIKANEYEFTENGKIF